MRCPCGSGDDYDDCCGPLHRGEREALTAAALMRSRYSAYAVGDAAYLRRTWHPSTCPDDLDLDGRMQWTGLEIVTTDAGGPFEMTGAVEFRAHYRAGGRRGIMHERSSFVREDGSWMYLRG